MRLLMVSRRAPRTQNGIEQKVIKCSRSHTTRCQNEFERGEREVGGGTRPAQSARKKILSCPTSFCGSTNAISRIGERFRDMQYSLVRFLFAVLLHVCVLTVPSLCPAICKSGEHVPPPVSDGVVAKLARM